MKLTEILVCILITVILLAIAVPSVRGILTMGQESDALATISNLAKMSQLYAQMCPFNGFEYSLYDMGPGNAGDLQCIGQPLIDSTLGSSPNNKDSYHFVYAQTNVDAGTGVCHGFTITATPLAGALGKRTYFVNETMVIRYSDTGTATVSSTPLP